MLYTIVSLNDIFYNGNDESVKVKQNGTRFLEYRKLNDKYEISRVISTDLKDYLDKNNDLRKI